VTFFIKLAFVVLGATQIGWFWGTILGLIAGHYAVGVMTGRVLILPGARKKRQKLFLETVFILMGRLAKSDGRVSESEIAHAQKFMAQLGMEADRRREAISLFKKGNDPALDVDGVLNEFMKYCGQSANLRQLLMMYLLGAALADGSMHENEELLLRKIGMKLKMSAMAVERMIAMSRAQQEFAGGAGAGGWSGGQQGYAGPMGSRVNPLDSAYAALGVKQSDTDAVVKRAYRKLMSENHPDKLIGQGVPEDMVRVATERSQEVQKAYDLIKKSRAK